MPERQRLHKNQAVREIASAAKTFDEKRWMLIRYRWIGLIAGLLYTGWRFMYQIISPGSYDSYWQRGIVSCMFLAVTAWTFLPEKKQKYLVEFFFATVTICTVHCNFLIFKNDITVLYALGGYCVYFASGSVFTNKKHLLFYYAVCLLMTGGLFAYRLDAKSFTLFLGSVSGLFVSYASLMGTLSLLSSLQTTHAKLAEQHQTLDNMLNSLGQGFLSFGRDGICLPVYSRATEGLLEGVPAGRAVWDVLKIPASDIDEIKTWIEFSFDERMSFESMMEMAPKSFPHSQGRSVVLEFNPARDESGRIHEIVIVATDKTEEFAASKRADTEVSYTKMITSIVKQKAGFHTFWSDFRAKMASFEKSTASEADLRLNFPRFLHTFKGGAGIFNMHDLVLLTHGLEDEWKTTPDPRRLVQGHCRILRSYLDGFAHDHADILGSSLKSADRVVEKPLHEIRKLFRDAEAMRAPLALRESISELATMPVGSFFEAFRSVEQTAQTQNKKLNPLRIHGGDIPVFPEAMNDLLASFIHAFNNVVEHGLETPEERRILGKPEAGTINVHFAKHRQHEQDWLIIEVKDDGRGIDAAHLRKKVRERGLVASENDRELLQILFEPSFSTKEHVTEHSGRGVGLDALKTNAEALGGTATIASESGHGTVVTVRLPYVDAQDALSSNSKAA